MCVQGAMAVERFVSRTLELLQEEREAEVEDTRYISNFTSCCFCCQSEGSVGSEADDPITQDTLAAFSTTQFNINMYLRT